MKLHAASSTDCILAANIGNTQIQLGLFADDDLRARWIVTAPQICTFHEAKQTLRNFLDDCIHEGWEPLITSSIVSSVVPSLTQPWIDACKAASNGLRPLIVGPGLKSGLPMRFKNPSEVGSDRIACAIAARNLCGSPVVSINFGTTTNFDVIDETGAFAGGIIAPGLRLSVQALSDAAARLTMVEMHAPQSTIGRTTVEAMQSGAVLGEIARIEGLLDMVWDELGSETPVILSGNDAAELAELISFDVTVADDLVLQGLFALHQLNRG